MSTNLASQQALEVTRFVLILICLLVFESSFGVNSNLKTFDTVMFVCTSYGSIYNDDCISYCCAV